MKENLLIVNICKEKLHYLEFVKPICDILDNNRIRYFVRDYIKVSKDDLKKASRIIICGTSLFDNYFIKNLRYFNWIMDFDKPILGICGGMHIIGSLFGGKIRRCTEIGFHTEYFSKEFLGLKEKCEVYHLHNNFIDFSKLNDFEVYCGGEVNSHPDLVNSEEKISKSKCSQAIKHREENIYGMLFHPEVRNKEIIRNFCLK
ncbi:hypothetical protein J4218_05150 [Candidatus Pacearchaeota archaeon]|nr:hypothetical protein [Candidatus Pacearchaeota archaeon]